MARKDVDLVIRAKDEAENVVRAITKALNDFNDAQSTTATRSEKTDTALGKLGAAYGVLQKAISGNSVGQKLAEEMTKAEAATGRLQATTAKTAAELAQMKTNAAGAEASLARLTVNTEKVAKAQADYEARLANSKKSFSALKLEMNTLAQATKGLESQQEKLPVAIAKQEAAIAKTVARLAELNAAAAAAERPSKTLSDQIAKANDRFGTQTQKLGSLKTALVGVQSDLAKAGTDMAKFASDAGKAETEIARQAVVLGKIKGIYGQISSAAKAAAQSQIATTNSVDKLTSKLASETAQLEVAQVSFTELSKAVGLADGELKQLTGQGIARLQGALSKQQSILAGAKEQYKALSGAALEMEAAIGQAGVPTRKMSEDFATLKAQVAGSEAILEQARVTFMEMAASFRTGGKDLEGLERIEKEFVATQGTMSAAINKATTDYQRNLAAIKALHAEQERGGGARTRLPPPVPAAPPVGPWNALSEAFNRLYGDSRKSLSLTQRLRGEVLSLIAAYGGFYGVVSLLGNVVGAYQTLEAAQARLNVANNGDIAQSSDDLDFLRRTADRLGVELGTLAQEYSKFAIATKGTNLAGENTRKIFLSVAEAARVNRSSNEELSGVFVALTQIVSKGAVQMEELRQQLGDRLPGALQIMADGLGVTTAELIKMMEAGEVTSDALVPFAAELDKRFGPGLGEALAGTTVALGRLKNAAFQALVQFGKGGFIESFTTLANKLTDLLQSANFSAFIDSASSSFAFLIDVLSTVVDNFQSFVVIVTGFAGLKLAPVIIGIYTAFRDLTVATKTAVATQAAVRAAMGATAASGTAAAAGVSAFRLAIQALTSSTGVGLAITLIAGAIGYWATSADLATEAMQSHKEMVDLVKNAYDEVGGSVEKFQQNITDLTVTAASENLGKIDAALAETKAGFENVLKLGPSGFDVFAGFGDGTAELRDEAKKLFDQFNAGKIDAQRLRSEIDKLNTKYDDGGSAVHKLALTLDEYTGKLAEQSKAQSIAQTILTALTGTVDKAQAAFDKLGGKATESGDAINAGFTAAMDKLRGSVEALDKLAPKTKTGMDEIAAGAQDLQENYEAAVAAANKLPDAIMRAAAQQDALNEKAKGMATLFDANQGVIDGGFGGSLVDRIIGVESGGNAAAKNPLSSATGLGQFIESTWLRMFKEYFPDRAAGLTDAMILEFRKDSATSRAMVELYLRENAQHLQKAGVAITDANLYLSHFLGPGGATALLSSAPGTRANDVLSAGQINANAGILDGKTREEIIAWAQRKVGISKEELSVAEALNDVDKARLDATTKGAEDALKRVEDQKKDTAERLTAGEQELAQQALINAGKERQAEIEKAIAAAKKENPNITQAEIDKIAQQTGAIYDLAHAEELASKPKEAAQKAEEAVNNLLSQRNSLMEQFNTAKAAGNIDAQADLKNQMTEVNKELLAAIENAKAMWLAVGGQEADTAIAKLNASKVAAQGFSATATQNYLEWSKLGDLFVTGLAGAFDTFAKKVADGENPLEALRDSFLQFAADFLIQIAQMIIKQAIFNALSKAFGGTAFGSLIGLAHTGGRVGSARAGSGNGSRRVSPALFAGAPRYHQGGIVGLKPGEVPLIAQEGERILTEAEDKALGKTLAGAGQAPAADPKVRVVNGIDSASFLEAALASPAGEKVILNFMRANANAVSGSRG